MQTCLKTLGTLALLLLANSPAPAQDQYPSQNIKIIVPTNPGATTDILARVMGQALSQSWGRSVIIENKPGADEMLGVDAVAKSAPDGHTLLVTSNGGITVLAATP